MTLLAALEPVVVPYQFWSVVFFVLGCTIGSFLNVCIHRLPRGMSIATPPSHCPQCGTMIPWYRNLPLITWVVQQGRCAACANPIPVRYVLVEMLTGLLFYLVWVAHGLPLGVPFALCLLTAGLVAATFIDLEHFIIPDSITLGGTAVGLVLSFLVPRLHGEAGMLAGLGQGILGAGIGAGVVYLVLRLGKLLFGKWKCAFEDEQQIVFTETELVLPAERIPYDELFYRRGDAVSFEASRVELVDRCCLAGPVRVSMEKIEVGGAELDPAGVPYLEATVREVTLPREAMGLGDVKFMAALGAFLGWPAVLFIILASSIIGAAFGIAQLIWGRREASTRLAYGPFLAAAAMLWILFSPQLLRWFRAI